MEDPSARRPVPPSTRRTKKLHGPRLLKQKASRLQSILLLAAQLTQRKVGALKVIRQHAKGLLENSFNRQTVLLARARRQREARDVPRRTYTRRLDILRKQRQVLLGEDKLAEIKIRGVRLRCRIEAMPPLDYRVDDILEELEALLVTTRKADTEVGPQHTSLHAVGQRVPLGRLDIFQHGEKLRRHGLTHQRSVEIREGRHLRKRDVLEVVRVLIVRG